MLNNPHQGVIMPEHSHINSEITSSFLKETLLDLMPEPGAFGTGIPGLRMARENGPTALNNCFYIPMIVLMAKGSKQVYFGSEEFIYSENQCLVTQLDLPSLVSIANASPDKPCLAVSLELDTHIITDLIAEMPQPKNEFNHKTAYLVRRGMAVTDVDPYVLDAFLRLTELNQKRLRLYEAHRLMLTENQNASSAAIAVGYENPAQFNREYKQMFGESPYRNIQRIINEKAITVL
jgi:hypothetical protein